MNTYRNNSRGRRGGKDNSGGGEKRDVGISKGGQMSSSSHISSMCQLNITTQSIHRLLWPIGKSPNLLKHIHIFIITLCIVMCVHTFSKKKVNSKQ